MTVIYHDNNIIICSCTTCIVYVKFSKIAYLIWLRFRSECKGINSKFNIKIKSDLFIPLFLIRVSSLARMF